jgi:protein gp37
MADAQLMAANSKIEWTDATWPVVQGCDYESPGCSNCYAAPLLWRMMHHPNPKISTPLAGLVEARGDKRVWTGKIALREDRLSWPLTLREPHMIFVPSHGDLFHPDVPDWFIDRAVAVMMLTPEHTYQLLSKRSDRQRDYFRDLQRCVESDRPRFSERWGSAAFKVSNSPFADFAVDDAAFPLPNLWIGVSAEDQLRWDQRTAHLRDTPAAIRFVSAEPMLGWIEGGEALTWLNWVILGNESGNVARDGNVGAIRRLLGQCQAAGVAAFVKQLGRFPVDPENGIHEAPHPSLTFHDKKGGDPGEWPPEFRVRQFPKVSA